jgi:hypothetical protein
VWELVLVFYYYMRVMNICGCARGLRSQKNKEFWNVKNNPSRSDLLRSLSGLTQKHSRPGKPPNPMLVRNVQDDQPESPAHLVGSENQEDRNLDSKVTNDDPLYDMANYIMESQAAQAPTPERLLHSHADADDNFLHAQEMLDNTYSLCPIHPDCGYNQALFGSDSN